MPKIQILFDTPLATYVKNLEADRYILGRNEECDIVIDHRIVSRKHATLIRDSDGGYTMVDGVEDVPSANGLWVGEYGYTIEESVVSEYSKETDRVDTHRTYSFNDEKTRERIIERKLQDGDVVYFEGGSGVGIKYFA